MEQERDLAEMIRRLEADRRRHSAAIAAIDEALAQVSRVVGRISNSSDDAPELPVDGFNVVLNLPRRGRFEQTGERSVLEFIRRRGNPTTSEINNYWKSEGRRGVANVILLRLIKQGVIRRQTDSEVRGSRYLLGAGGENGTADAAFDPIRSAGAAYPASVD
jgi:hypothetical protein